MTKSISIVLLFLCSFLTNRTFGQPNNSPFGKDQLEEIEQQAKDYLVSFTDGVSQLSKNSDKTAQRKIINNVLNLFKDNAKIETLNVNGNKRAYNMPYYLTNIVANYSNRFGLVVLKFENVVVDHNSTAPIKNAKGVITGYKGTFSFSQIFCVTDKFVHKESNKYEMEDFKICDQTKKEGEFIYKKIEGTTGSRWILLLGDIEAKEVENLKK